MRSAGGAGVTALNCCGLLQSLIIIVIACHWGIRLAYNRYATRFVITLSSTERLKCYTKSDYDGLVACCCMQGMADRILRVHMQSPAGLSAWMTLSYRTFPEPLKVKPTSIVFCRYL